MSATPYIELLSDNVYSLVCALSPDASERAAVKLRDGGVLITSADGDHVQVLVQPVHFLPGQELPF